MKVPTLEEDRRDKDNSVTKYTTLDGGVSSVGIDLAAELCTPVEFVDSRTSAHRFRGGWTGRCAADAFAKPRPKKRVLGPPNDEEQRRSEVLRIEEKKRRNKKRIREQGVGGMQDNSS